MLRTVWTYLLILAPGLTVAGLGLLFDRER